MARPLESSITISCLQCDWSVEATSTTPELSGTFLEAAQSHANQHQQHAIEIVQRLRVYSENYVEPTPPPQDTRDAAAIRDTGFQTGFPDRARRGDHYPKSTREKNRKVRFALIGYSSFLHESYKPVPRRASSIAGSSTLMMNSTCVTLVTAVASLRRCANSSDMRKVMGL